MTGTVGELKGIFAPLSGKPVQGYEIHMGRTEGQEVPFAFLHADGEVSYADGMQAGNVYGTYLHGIFDNGEILSALGEALYAYKGIAPQTLAAFDAAGYKEKQFDLLAQTMRDTLDMEAVYQIIDAGLKK